MKHIFFLIIGLLFCCSTTYAQQLDSAEINYNRQLVNLAQKSSVIKQKIKAEFEVTDTLFLQLSDSAFKYSQQPFFTYAQRIKYAGCIIQYMNAVYKNGTEEEMVSGKYTDGWRYFPLMIEWQSRNQLLENLMLFRTFSLPYAALIPDDSIARIFLLQYVHINPDILLRNAVHFAGRPFAIGIVDSAAAYAPFSVKRYLTSENEVSYLMQESKAPASQAIIDIYEEFGPSSKAYNIIYSIIRDDVTLDQADSIGDNPLELFKKSVAISKQPDAIGQYSIYRSMEEYAIDRVPKVNDLNVEDNMSILAEQFRLLTAEEAFAVAVYSHREMSVQTFANMLNIIKRKIYTPLPPEFIYSLNGERLRSFLDFAERNGKLDQVMQLMSPKALNHVYAVLSEQLLPDPRPDISIFQDMPVNQMIKGRMAETAFEKNTKINRPLDDDKDVLPKAPKRDEIEEDIAKEIVEIVQKPDTFATVVPALEPVVAADVEVLPPLSLLISEEARNIMSLKKNLFSTLQNLQRIMNEPFAEQILLYAAQVEPDEVMKKTDLFKSKFYSTRILEVAAKQAPTSLKRYLYNPTHPIYILLNKSSDTVVQKLFYIGRTAGYQTKAFLLADAVIKGRLTLAQVDAAGTTPQGMFRELAKICSRESYIGQYSVDREMTDYCLRLVREINDKIAFNDPEPFKSVQNLSAEEIYFLMIFGREEVVTASFNGLFLRFLQKLHTRSLASFFKGVSYGKFRTFLSECSSYNKFELIMQSLPDAERDALLIQFVSNLDADNYNHTEAVDVAEALTNIKNDAILANLHSSIRQQYIQAYKDTNKTAIAVYGVLASLIDGGAKSDQAWFKKISRQYKIPVLTQLTIASLLNENKGCVEQMFFYNDADGRDSYYNFVNTFKNNQAWKVEDKGSYVLIKSSSGNNVEIYANKPEFEYNGQEAIKEYFKLNKINPSVMIHRGHSFHTVTTLQHVDEHVKLLFVGSCGGFYKLANAVDNAPDAHIIATKQIGTKSVNDPMIFTLNENIRNDKPIIWKDFWDSMRLKIGGNPMFADYVPPYQNLKSLFSRAYYQILGI